MSREELRAHKRIPYTENILINNKIFAKGIDISEGGIFVSTGHSFTPGNIVDITFTLQETKLTAQANIQHSQSGVGMGLKFMELTEEHKGLIRKFIEQKSAGSEEGETERKLILLVEDSELSRRMYKSKLMQEGFQVHEANNGLEAIKYLNVEKPDLIILDLYMEKLDGFKVLSMIRESPLYKETPVIVFSSKGDQDMINKVITAGADEFLSKSITPPAKLAEAVKKLLKSKSV